MTPRTKIPGKQERRNIQEMDPETEPGHGMF